MYKITNTTAKELSEALNGVLYGTNCKIQYISTDTREKFPSNCCFLTLNGEKFDGNEYIDCAIKKKALIITDKEIDKNINHILVKNTKIALGLIAKEFSNKAKVIAVTGSVGKTTVKNMISLVLREKYQINSTEKNENNEIGVAKTLLSTSSSDDFCVVEMGMRGLGQIDWLSYISSPETSVITNAESAHIELLESRENIFKAKTEVLSHTKKFCVVPYEKRFLTYKYQKIIPMFIGGEEIKYFNLRYDKEGICFCAKYHNEIINDIKISSYNENNVKNALFAICIGKIYGVSNQKIKNALRKYKGENMHEEFAIINGITVIKDCYNASYESMKGAIFSLVKYAEQKGYTPNLLLGDMMEIGEKAEEYHYRIGELAKDLGVKRLYATGNNAQNLMDGFLGGTTCENNEQMAKTLLKELNDNDVILVKASRSMRLERIIEKMEELSNE